MIIQENHQKIVILLAFMTTCHSSLMSISMTNKTLSDMNDIVKVELKLESHQAAKMFCFLSSSDRLVHNCFRIKQQYFTVTSAQPHHSFTTSMCDFTYLCPVLVRKSCISLPFPTVFLPFVQFLGDFSIRSSSSTLTYVGLSRSTQ